MQEHATRLIPFEHTGLRSVKTSSAEAELACGFKSLLVIQPPPQRGVSHGLFGEALENDDEELKFNTHPLTLICELAYYGWIHVTAVIDSAVISPDETQALLHQFAGIVGQINDNLERPVSSIISFDTVVAASSFQSDKLLSLQELETKAQRYLKSLPGIGADTVVLEELPSAMLAVFVCDSRANSNEPRETDLLKEPSRSERQVLFRLGEYLRQSMPNALMPFLCLPIKTLPKDSAGQPDREALRVAASNLCRRSRRNFMFPVTSEPWCPTPSQLPTAQKIMARVLGVKADDVGSEDDFFTLGGDSSAAMQTVMLCKKEGFSLTVRDIFQEGKIGRIASKFQPLATIKPTPDPDLDLSGSTRFPLLRLTCDFEKGKFENAVRAQLGIRSIDALEDAYPCTTVHEGLLWTQSHEPMDYQSHTIWEVTATGRDSPLCPFRLRDAWLILVRRHPALRTILINNLFPGKTCKRIHIVLRDSPGEVTVFPGVTNETMHRPNLQCGAGCQPYKFTIYQTQQNRVYCKLEGNQAFLDATSVSTLLPELAQAYSETLSSASGPPYRSVVEFFQGMSDAEHHANYWKNQMATAEPCIFPSLRREGTEQDTLNVTRIEIGDAIDLRQYCNTRGFTLSNVYQVAWGLTLRFYTNQNMICFGTLVSGRDLPPPGVHPTIGAFFNVLPCQLDLSRPDRLLHVLKGNQVEIANRLANQHCSLTDILRHSNHFGQRLFNTCISLEQQLSSLQVDGVCFTEIDTREPTEVRTCSQL
jgi:aryl carrier-like protein